MSKKEQSQTTKEDNPLFPPILIGKKLKEEDNGLLIGLITENSTELLKEYLETKNPEFLFQAIREDNSILQGASKYLDKNDDVMYIDEHTIAWQSIYHWQNIHKDWIVNKDNPDIQNNISKEKQALKAELHLTNIGKSLLISGDGLHDYYTDDGLVHLANKNLNGYRKLTYQNAEFFVKKFEFIRNTFSNTQTKRKPLENKKVEKKQDINKAVKKLGYKLSEKDINLFMRSNIDDVYTKTIRYIRLVHQKLCRICYEKKLSDITIRRIYQNAKKEITN